MSVLNDYKGSWLRGDVVAGVTVAAIAIPESLGYAKIAGLPIQTGLYCALLPTLMFALIGSSRQLGDLPDKPLRHPVSVAHGPR